MDVITAKALLERYFLGDASQEEMIIIEQWYQRLLEVGEWKWAEGEREQLEVAMEVRLLGRINEEAGDPAGDGGEVKRMAPGRRRMVGWAAAAVLLAGLAGVWLLVVRRGSRELASVSQRYLNDVGPGRNAAVLTLAGGKTILLDDSAPRTIGRQGNAVVLNDSGQLVYKVSSPRGAAGAGSGASATAGSEIFYNTLTTQKGNQYHLTLPDGTKVWLNAVSSITYPTAFTGKERKVIISGEAYFEVVKNQQLPFVVQQADMTVQVLGTSFDVNGYGDDSAVRTTLVEGKISVGRTGVVAMGRTGAAGVAKTGAVSVLEPGQQAVVGKVATGNAGNVTGNAGNGISINNDPDIEAVLAWKNGGFAFKDADIESIMRQVERWYDVKAVYEAKISKHFVADIPRNVPLSKLLKLLEATDQVHFKIDGKKVIVMP
jgi:transmembrane sensor